MSWLAAGGGYELSLVDGKLVARGKGKLLASVPKALRESAAAEQLEALRDWLDDHARACATQVESWMLRSLPVPSAVIGAVWDDPAWPLANLVVAGSSVGLLRAIDARKGLGIVDLDGETAWIRDVRVTLPHPILLDDLDGWRELVTQLGVVQPVAQLHRETYRKSVVSGMEIDDFADGKFAMMMHVAGKARALGYRVRGGFATAKIGTCEARYWIGAEAPDSATVTGALSWVDARERPMSLADVGEVAFSEGMRMAATIYAARVVDQS